MVKIKTGYYLELLLGSTKSETNKDKNGQNEMCLIYKLMH